MDHASEAKLELTPLSDRLSTAQGAWRRTGADYVLTALSILLSVGALVVALAMGIERTGGGNQVAPGGGGLTPAVAKVSPIPPAGAQCSARGSYQPDKTLVMLAARTEGQHMPELLGLKDAVASYFGFDVQIVANEEYHTALLENAAGIVVFGNAKFPDEGRVWQALNDAQDKAVPTAWIGLGGERFGSAMGLSFQNSDAVAGGGAQGRVIQYNDVEIPTAGQEFSAAVDPASPGVQQVLGTLKQADGTISPLIVQGQGVIYAGFLPFNGYNSNLSLVAIVDALSQIFGPHPSDPRVVLRLEDINGETYGPNDTHLAATTDYLLAENAFMHLSIIPESVDEDQSIADERLIADAGSVAGLVKLVNDHPGELAIVQHGFRHSRRDARNVGCTNTGCAHEFFPDDDVTMGPQAAAAFARQRLEAGREVLTRHLRRPWIFEAPHYVMSPAQVAVAQDMFPVILHAPWIHAGEGTNFFYPWFTQRETTVYAPSDVGYVGYDDPASVTRILNNLRETARILPDPVVVVFYHPFLTGTEIQGSDLEALIQGIKQLGYRFANACAELDP